MPPRDGNAEKPSRVLFVRNINYNATEAEVREVFEKFGSVLDVFSRIESRGMAFITFSDIRDAEQALYQLQGTVIRDREIDVHYSLPRDVNDKYYDRPESQQNDTLFVTVRGCTTTVSNEEIHELFGRYGEIKAIRDCPKSPAQKFVEFYDLLGCKNALGELNNYPLHGGVLDVKFAIDRKRESTGSTSTRSTHRDKPSGGSGRNRSSRGPKSSSHRSAADPYPSPASRRSNYVRGDGRRPPPPRVDGAMNNLTSVLQEQANSHYMSGSNYYSSPQNPSPIPYSGPPGGYPPPNYQNYSNMPPPGSQGGYGNSYDAAAQLSSIIGQLQQQSSGGSSYGAGAPYPPPDQYPPPGQYPGPNYGPESSYIPDYQPPYPPQPSDSYYQQDMSGYPGQSPNQNSNSGPYSQPPGYSNPHSQYPPDSYRY